MFWLLSSFYYFYFSIVGIYVIFLPKVLSEVGYSASEIGIIFAAAPLVRFVLPFLFMRGLQLGRAVFLAALVLVVFAAFSFYITLEHFWLLLGSNVLLGTGLGLVLPYAELIALETIQKERYGKARLFGSLGFIVVALVLVRFLSSAFVAVDFLAALAVVMAMNAYVLQRHIDRFSLREPKADKGRVSLLKDYKLWLGLLLMQMSFGSFYNFFTIYETAHGISLSMTINLWSFGVLVEVGMLFVQARFLQKNLLGVLQISILATVFRWYLLYAFATNLPLLFFAQSLHALSFALFHSAAIAYLHQRYSNKSLAQQLFSGISYGLGALLGALLAGYVYEYFSTYLFASSALIAFGSFVMIALFAKEQSQKA